MKDKLDKISEIMVSGYNHVEAMNLIYMWVKQNNVTRAEFRQLVTWVYTWAEE
jgi:hypothetical protein